MPMNIYEQNRILNASPVELVRILYSAAIQEVGNARASLRSGDIAARSREISKAQAIVMELATAVDIRQSREIGERLLALYDYMQVRMAEAHRRQEDRPLAEVNDLLRTLQEAWLETEALAAPSASYF
jgi:flagellar secretion chaperone FliS